MKTTIAVAFAIVLTAVFAAPAHADAQPSARDIQAAVDSYLASNQQDANLVGGPGSAGYDQGFWIKGGDFSLKINLTLQARYEAWIWDSSQKAGLGAGAGTAGSTSGFSLPRATLKFSGTAPCNISYYMELEFGHYGQDVLDRPNAAVPQLGPLNQSYNFDNTREAWIQWSSSDAFNFRMGQIRTATTRQAMVAPEMQQFVDVSLATAYMGWTMPGYTDRNRDHGFAIHGAFGCNSEWSYLLTVTNGDGGDSIRNVIDQRTSDNLAYSGRLNYAFLKPIGYQEGALRQTTCDWYGEIGVWGYYYTDRVDRPHTQVTDATRYGVDLALGYGGFSFTAAYNMGSDDFVGGSVDHTAYLVQLGYHFPGTAWEIAARYDAYDSDNPAALGALPGSQMPLGNGSVSEFAFGVNYYLNGHGNKLSLDVSFVGGNDAGSAQLFDVYAGYPGNNGAAGTGSDTYGMLIRFQWQLAL
jgi:hypothetical protein